MPRPRIPRLTLASLRNRDGSAGAEQDMHEQDQQERDKLVLVVEVVGFVVAASLIAGFVLMAANSGGDQEATHPAVPTITAAGDPGPAETEPDPTSKTSKTRSIVPPAAGKQADVVAPKPKPKPKPAPPPATQPSEQPNPGDEVTFADPFDECSPEGAHAFTKRRHFPMECRGGHWQFEGFGDHGHHGGGGH